MVEYLRESHRMIARLLAQADFDDAFPYVFGHPEIVGAEFQWLSELALLLRKAQMHMTAVIHANRSTNLHSMAVHARVILECAAQVQFKAQAASDGSPSALMRVLNAGEYDFQDTLLRMSHGNVDGDELREMLIDARERAGDNSTRRPRRVTISDRVSHLVGGGDWYGYLSERFCGDRAEWLSGSSMSGGVVSTNTEQDRLAIAGLLDYLTLQVAYLLFGYGFLLIGVDGDDQPFEDGLELLGRVRADSAEFRGQLGRRINNHDVDDEHTS